MNGGKLGAVLAKLGKVSLSQLEQALEVQKRDGGLIGDVLVRLNFVTPDDIARALAIQLNIPYIDLSDNFRLEREEVQLVPESVARRYVLIPMKKTEDHTLTLVMADPTDMEAVNMVRSMTDLEVHKAISTPSQIQAVIDRFYRDEAHIERTLKDLVKVEEDDHDDHEEEFSANSDQLRVLAQDAPVVRFVNLLLMQAVRDRASDIHFEPHEKIVRVRLRVDGVLKDVTPPPKNLYPGIVSRIKILAKMDIAERRLPLDGRFNFQLNSHKIDVRVSSLPEVYGEKLVLRILDGDALPSDLGAVGFDAAVRKDFERILLSTSGIVLVTGPTGSGKTSTLYSALSTVRDPGKNVQTVEDPVEYQLEGVNQMQVKAGIGLDFADALRSILRQDPDVIMIGEIRDAETARIAMRAALTGHLVLSTLHTNDAPSAFLRLRDIGLEPYLVGATVKLVIAQRLVRKICEHCREPVDPPPEVREIVESAWSGDEPLCCYVGAGCPECNETGYAGRTAIFEFLETNNELRRLIANGADQVEFGAAALKTGMDPLHISGLRRVHEGITTVAEVLRVSALQEA